MLSEYMQKPDSPGSEEVKAICEELLGIKSESIDHTYDYARKFIQFLEQEAGSAVLMSSLQIHFGSYSEFGLDWYGVIFMKFCVIRR